MRAVRGGAMRAANIHAVAVKVHVAVVWRRLRGRGRGGEGGAGGRVVVGRVEGGGDRGGVEHGLAEGVVVH